MAASSRHCWQSDRRGLLVGFFVAVTVHAGIYQQLNYMTLSSRQIDIPPLVTLSLIAAPAPQVQPEPAAQPVAPVVPPEPVAQAPTPTPRPKPVRPERPVRPKQIDKRPDPPLPRDIPPAIASASPSAAGPPPVADLPLEPPRADAAYLRNPPPDYPKILLRRKVEGSVLVRARVQGDGRCSQVQLKESSGFRLFDEAALSAVKDWRFVPARKGAQTVVAWVDVPIAFRIARTR